MVWTSQDGKPGEQTLSETKKEDVGPLVQPWAGLLPYGSLPHFIPLSDQISPHQRLSLSSLPKIYGILYYTHFPNLFSVAFLLNRLLKRSSNDFINFTCIRMGLL